MLTLNDLDASQVLLLLEHCNLSPAVINALKEQPMNGKWMPHFVCFCPQLSHQSFAATTGAELPYCCENDLMDVGIQLLPARAFLRRIIEWKDEGLPVDFSVTIIAHAVQPAIPPPPPAVVETVVDPETQKSQRDKLCGLYIRARYFTDADSWNELQQLRGTVLQKHLSIFCTQINARWYPAT